MTNSHSNTKKIVSGGNRHSGMTAILQLLFIAFLVGLVGSFRAVSSISTGLLLVAGIVHNRMQGKPWLNPQCGSLFIIGCIAFFFIQLISLLYTQNMEEGWRQIRIKTGIVLIPLAIACTDFISDHTRKKLVNYYCLLLPLAALFCLSVAWSGYRQTGDSSLFFYHKLAGALQHHAVFFSILAYFGIVFLMEKIRRKEWIIHWMVHILLVIVLSIFLFLLSSKLVIPFFLLYLICFFVRLIIAKKLSVTWVILLFTMALGLIAAVMLTRNPVSERFKEIVNTDRELLNKKSFDKADYFNGLQFRMIQWRFVGEILSENKAWFQGVGVGDAQNLLDSHYVAKNMYIGAPWLHDRGYLSYHTHNQFLQSIFQAGIPAVLAFLAVWVSLFIWGFRFKSWETASILALLIAWAFSDAVFESQYGVMIFTFFPLFVCLGREWKGGVKSR